VNKDKNMVVYFVSGAVVLLAVLIVSFIAHQRERIYDDVDLEAIALPTDRVGNTASSHRAGNIVNSPRENSTVRKARVTSHLDNVSILHFWFKCVVCIFNSSLTHAPSLYSNAERF
jgi:hypothetical protein